MSGFEIAGIVLGTIPLIISALEHYHDGVSTMQRWRRYERERQNLARILRTEQIQLQNTCEALLEGLVSPSEVAAMITEPFSGKWRDRKIQIKLRARLHDSIDLFESIVKDVQAAMVGLARRLGVDTTGKDIGEGSSTKRELRRALFTISRSTYEDLTSSIRQDISSLQDLTHQNISLEPHRQKLSQVQLLGLLQELSLGLHGAMGSSLSCRCLHTIQLKLTTYPSDVMYAKSEEEKLQELDTRLLFSVYDGAPTITEQDGFDKNWRELRVSALPMQQADKWPGEQPCPRSAPRQAAEKMSAESHVTDARKSARKLHRVHMDTCRMIIQSDDRGMGNITDLCAVTAVWSKTSDKCYGTMADITPRPGHRRGIRPSGRQYLVHAADSVGIVDGRVASRHLSEFLVPHQPRLSILDKAELAVIVSSSFLQLHGTPWLSHSIHASDLLFLQPGGSSIYHTKLSDNLFLWAGMDAAPAASLASIVTERRNPALLSLGFLLLEIFFQLPIGRGSGTDKELLERQYREAQGLLPKLQRQSRNYFGAVSRCLDGELHKPQYDEMAFRENFYAGVVSLLKKDLEVLA